MSLNLRLRQACEKSYLSLVFENNLQFVFQSEQSTLNQTLSGHFSFLVSFPVCTLPFSQCIHYAQIPLVPASIPLLISTCLPSHLIHLLHSPASSFSISITFVLCHYLQIFPPARPPVCLSNNLLLSIFDVTHPFFYITFISETIIKLLNCFSCLCSASAMPFPKKYYSTKKHNIATPPGTISFDAITYIICTH